MTSPDRPVVHHTCAGVEPFAAWCTIPGAHAPHTRIDITHLGTTHLGPTGEVTGRTDPHGRRRDPGGVLPPGPYDYAPPHPGADDRRWQPNHDPILWAIALILVAVIGYALAVIVIALTT